MSPILLGFAAKQGRPQHRPEQDKLIQVDKIKTIFPHPTPPLGNESYRPEGEGNNQVSLLEGEQIPMFLPLQRLCRNRDSRGGAAGFQRFRTRVF